MHIKTTLMHGLARRIAATLTLLGMSMVATAPRAEPSNVSATGFVVTHRAEITAPPSQAWKAIVALPQWWNGKHSGSGSAANFSLDAQAGGCFCERWVDASGAANSVQHGQVVMVQAGRVLRLAAALGPLQDLAVNGVLNIVTSTGTGAEAGKHFLRMGYRVSGDASANLDKLAGPVDGVIGEQFKRLQALIETGKAE